MIKGSLKLVSVPGLLQMLANEPARAYRLTVEADGQIAQLYVIDGLLIDSRFGILEGVDALSEILYWEDGEFVVDELKNPSDWAERSKKGNVHCSLEDLGSFHDQCTFLRRVNIGLSSEIVPSSSFGQPEWQEALYIQPLGKVDYDLLGWITDGRTMRQAMSELNFNIREAIGILYRLVLTGSVEVVKPEGAIDKAIDVPAIVAERMEKLANSKIGGKGHSKGATIVSIKDKPGANSEVKAQAEPHAGHESEHAGGASRDTSDYPVIKDDEDRQSEKSGEYGIPIGKDTDTQELPTVGDDIGDEVAKSILDSPLNRLIQKEVDGAESSDAENLPGKKASVKIEATPFEMKKTDPLPLVSIDIERLLNTSFKLTAKGAELLEDSSEGDMVAGVLRQVKLGKSLLLVLTDSNRSDASIMATYKYCLENELIEHHDPVVTITIDLLLDKLDLIQYLLQRRRVTGEQLKELSTISERQGIEIIKLLIGSGAVLPADLDRLKQEKERFAPK